MTFKKSDISFIVGVLAQILNRNLVNAMIDITTSKGMTIDFLLWTAIAIIIVGSTIGFMLMAEYISEKFGS